MDPRVPVMVLEGDPLIRQLLERWLSEAGYLVLQPDCAEWQVALVIADVPDPNSAHELIQSLRAYAAPVLVLSARFRRGLAGSSAAARRLGVNRVLPKPFTRRELLLAVQAALKGAA